MSSMLRTQISLVNLPAAFFSNGSKTTDPFMKYQRQKNMCALKIASLQDVIQNNRDQREKDLKICGDVGNAQNPNHLRDVYDGFSGVLEKHSPTILKKVGKVVAYEITDMDQNLVLDFKHRGQVYMDDPRQPRLKPDLKLIMKKDAFNDICEGKLGGMMGVIQGRVSFKGSLIDLQNFDRNVVKTYFGPDLKPIQS